MRYEQTNDLRDYLYRAGGGFGFRWDSAFSYQSERENKCR